MMKKTILFLMVITLLVSCKKEKIIQNNLWSGVGEWNIERMDMEIMGFPLTVEDAGTVSFYKDKTGKMKIAYEMAGIPINEETIFDYSVTEDELITIDRTPNSNTYGDTTRYQMEWKKNEMKLVNGDITTFLKKK